MAAPPEPEAPTTAPPSVPRWRRSRPELLVELVFGPVSRVLVWLLLPLRVPPPVVVLANGAAGFGAAYLVFREQAIAAALLLQLKTVLDNADGRLARLSGRTSALGRYLDTEIDLLVNVALVAALGHVTGSWLLALAAFPALTVVLSADFNEDVLHRRARGAIVVTEPPASSEGMVARALAGFYHVFFAPQDRALQGLATRRLQRAGADSAQHALAYHDGFTSIVLANLGLSTQLAVLGVCLAVGAPRVYLWIVLGCLAALPLLQLRREQRLRRAL